MTLNIVERGGRHIGVRRSCSLFKLLIIAKMVAVFGIWHRCVVSGLIISYIFCTVPSSVDAAPKRRVIESSQCPKVNSYRTLDLEQMQGSWYVIKYYASSEESEIYRCMRTVFSLSADLPEISMNFTFTFKDDPDNEHLYGNITWRIPDSQRPSHWVHSENIYEGDYNTYVLDLDANGDKSWVILLHCAEKRGSPRYLSSFIMSRQSSLPKNVIAYLRDKLPRYDINLEYLFDMDQTDCARSHIPDFYRAIKDMLVPKSGKLSKHPLKHPDHHK